MDDHDGITCGTRGEGLATRRCEPCRGGVPPLRSEAIARLLRELEPGWRVVGAHHLEKRYDFADFRGALDFVVRVGELAEAEGHHPALHVSWGCTLVEIWTHKIDGLTETDFILAAKIDQVVAPGGTTWTKDLP
jgi:4a-hydroxytetrahydrobiopterin dehydratase